MSSNVDLEDRNFSPSRRSALSQALEFLIRPDVAFAILWMIVVAAYFVQAVNYFEPLNSRVILLLIATFAIPFLFGLVFRRFMASGNEPAFQSEDVPGKSFVLAATVVWTVGFAIIVAYSGGLPIFWSAMSIPRYYYEFGIPTFSGAWNTLRVVIAVGAILAFERRRSDWILVGVVFVLSLTVMAEINRGGLLLYALCLAAAAVLAGRTFKRQAVWLVVIVIMAVSGIGLASATRSQDPKAVIAISSPFAQPEGKQEQPRGEKPQSGQISLGGRIASEERSSDQLSGLKEFIGSNKYLAWGYLYLTTPMANLNAAATIDIPPPPSFAFYSLYPLLPSIVRADIPPETRYPLPLLSPSYTMTTAYGPYVADFGFAFSAIAMGLQLLVGMLVYRVRHRYAWAALFCPMMFTTTMLGFFSNYFLTLLTPFHFVLALLFAAWPKRHEIAFRFRSFRGSVKASG